MNLETIKPRGRPRYRWLDEVREDGRMVGGEEWQEKVYDREEWRRLLSTARNHRILFMPMDWLDKMYPSSVVLSHTKVIIRWSLETAMFDLSVTSSCEGTVKGLKVPTLSMGYLKNGIFWCNKNFACKEQVMAAPAVIQDYHIHFENIEVFVNSFTLIYVRNLTVSLYLIWLFPGLCYVLYSHAGFSLFKTSPSPQSH